MHLVYNSMCQSAVQSATLLACISIGSLAGTGMLAAAEGTAVEAENSVSEEGEWSESAIAQGRNDRIDVDALATLPPSMRKMWSEQQKEQLNARSGRDRRQQGERVLDDIVPAFGVTYVTDQRDNSRGEALYHRAHRFLTHMNIRVMAGELGRRAPELVPATDENGRKLNNGDLQLLEREPLPEEVEIRSMYAALVALESRVAFPNTHERSHFNEIAGDLAKAQGLLNFDLTADGVKTIDEQYTAWRILIEVERQKVLESTTHKIMEEKGSTYARARRQAERMDIVFTFPALPLGADAMNEARTELKQLNAATAMQANEKAERKRRARAAAEDKAREEAEVARAAEAMMQEAAALEAEAAALETPAEVVEEAPAEVVAEAEVVEAVVEAAVEVEVPAAVEEIAEEEAVADEPAVEVEVETEEVEEVEEDLEFDDDF